MIRRLLVVASVVVWGLATSGCATELLLEAAREPIVTEYLASHVESGWRGDSGELVVCVIGWPTERPVSEPPQPYAMTVPAGVLESLGVSHGAAYDARAVLAWPAAEENIEDGCRERPVSASPVEVRRISALEPDGDGPATEKPLYELLAADDPGGAGPIIYSVDAGGGDGIGFIVYRRGEPPGGGARFVRLDPPQGTTYEYNAGIFLMPLAVAVDIAVILGIIYLCAQAPGSC